jgi:hypothetical protein
MRAPECEVEAGVGKVRCRGHADPREPDRNHEIAKNKRPSECDPSKVEEANDKEKASRSGEEMFFAGRPDRFVGPPRIMRKKKDDSGIKKRYGEHGGRGPGDAEYGERENARAAEPEDAHEIGGEESYADLCCFTKKVMVHRERDMKELRRSLQEPPKPTCCARENLARVSVS